ncbi:haloacid dehalogenase-like hydrolase family member protein [Theileria equi strain WA]|uniref:Haloacid dehalogenase-like hydrolase family member protein n=1 Tax=Theileria equi strain WA TaxID=1537102 RepID=L0AXT9_THEEQ|nr:haloacid dehalogenase-like hydrolase family member protein [Theileria equi strain WA]AFZ79729.1 haloacid dehalogenase-like hydrolase family member protein [Theileria equi strain WA]|eukprot:XP_004829395.1 haloacid dehalogenase-like hydrolase family member protein [Theileria equi strain WA]
MIFPLLALLASFAFGNGIDINQEKTNDRIRIERTLLRFVPLTKFIPKYRVKVRKVFDGDTLIWEEDNTYAVDVWLYFMGDDCLVDILTISDYHEGGNRYFVKVIINEYLREPIEAVPMAIEESTGSRELDAFSVESAAIEEGTSDSLVVEKDDDDGTDTDSVNTTDSIDDYLDTTDEEDEFVDAMESLPTAAEGDLETEAPSEDTTVQTPKPVDEGAMAEPTPSEEIHYPATIPFREKKVTKVIWKQVTKVEFDHLLKELEKLVLKPRVRGPSHSDFVRPTYPPKYFAIDIMRTFYSRDPKVMKENMESFGEARRSGYVLFFCTAETYLFTLNLMGPEFVSKTGYAGLPGVYNNGALVYDENGEVVLRKVFAKEFMRAFFINLGKHCTSNRCRFYTIDGSFTITDDKENYTINFRGLRRRKVLLEELLELPYIGISLKYKNVNIKGYINGIDYFGRPVKDGLYLISQVGVNKASGVAALMAHYNIPANACAFIGDGFNDIDIMEQSDFSFAVGNAPDPVKKHAKWVMERSYDEAAVSEVIYAMYGTGGLSDVHIWRGEGYVSSSDERTYL